MTKYILHGGNSNKRSDSNDAFYRGVIKSVPSREVTILCIYFARPEGRWEDSYAEDQSSLFAAARDQGITVNTMLATYDLDNVIQQISEADILFINGGRNGHLKETLQSIPNFDELINDKVVVGISAGANILSEYYYSSVSQAVKEGIGLLQIAMITHADRDAVYEDEIRQVCGDLPVYKIEEEQYLTLEM